MLNWWVIAESDVCTLFGPLRIHLRVFFPLGFTLLVFVAEKCEGRLCVTKTLSPVPLQGPCRTIMLAEGVLKQLWVPELDDLRQYVRGLPTGAIMGVGAFAAITTYWFAFRTKALKGPCDLSLQSVEISVGLLSSPTWK